jgi:hypothetical protein
LLRGGLLCRCFLCRSFLRRSLVARSFLRWRLVRGRFFLTLGKGHMLTTIFILAAALLIGVQADVLPALRVGIFAPE